MFEVLKLRISIILFLFSVFVGGVFSQNFIFRHITSDQGLSTNLINCIIQDSKGFMWIGTQEGLNRYDGYRIKVYKNEPNNPNSLSYSLIDCIAEINRNALLIGTTNGLNWLDLTNDSVKRFYINKEDLNAKENAISVIRLIDSDNVALGTDNGFVVFNLKTKNFRHYKFKVEGGVKVTDLLLYRDRLFISTVKKGLWYYNLKNEKIERANFTDEDKVSEGVLGLETINKMDFYAGKLYLGTSGHGIYRVDPTTFEIEKQKKFKSGNSDRNYVYDLKIRENVVYSATGGGLIAYNIISQDTNIYYKNIENKNSINDDKIRSITFDNHENLWLGTYVGGINVAYKSALKFSSPARYKQNYYKNLFLVHEDKQRNVWLSGDRKILMLPANSNKFVDYSNITKGKFDALCLYQESDNIYWFGTYGDGIRRLDLSTGKVTSYLSSDNGGTVLSINRLNNYLLVAGFFDGLFKIDLKDYTITQYTEKDGLDVLTFTSIYVDKNKTIWLLTDGGGVYQIEDFDKTDGKVKILNRFKTSPDQKSICSDVVYAINQDNSGNYWFGTNNGLSVYNGGQFKNFYESDGLANTFIYSLLKDSLGNFWMSTNKGITSFNPANTNKPIFKNYNTKDGLVNTEHNLGAACASIHGNMLFGGSNGYNIFRPSQIKDNLHVPPVYVVSMLRSGKEVQLDSNLIYKKTLKLNWRENYFQMEVVALDFVDPEKNKYMYKLEGYDEDWSEPSNVRYISYTELPGKNYTLKIKASNSDGVWNEKPYELKITIIPPFWKTTWFYILVVLFGTGGVILFTQLRTRQIKKENKILENKVAERTRELAEKNRDITSSIEYAKRIQEAILPSKDYIFSKLNKAFILYKPKDIVSGDFYWFGEKNGWKIFAVVDCTGHGVPGAFMSMIGHNLMHQIIMEKGITNPSEILNSLHKGVQDALRQGNNEVNTNDGMDCSILAINEEKQSYLWAGANRPIVLIGKSGTFEKLDGNKYPIGGAQFDINREFTCRTIEIKEETMAYMSSDGYADQFGGANGKKFMVRRFHDLLLDIHLKSPQEQLDLLNKNFEEWKSDHEQIDDVLVVGIAL